VEKLKIVMKIAIVIVALIVFLVAFAFASLNNQSANLPDSQPTSAPTPTPTAAPTTLPSPTPVVTPTPVPDVPVPTFTLTKAIRIDTNSWTGQTYSSVCANITIKNEDTVKHYEIEYKGHYGDSWIPLTFDLEKSTPEYTSILSEWLPNGEWDFRVKAYDDVGAFSGRSSDWSETKTITINEEGN
jgi:hypothetical protein